MKRRTTKLVLMVSLIVALATGFSARAGTECVDYQVTGPFVGTRGGSRCVNLPPQFSVPFSLNNCQGIPPAGATECIGADLYLP